MTIQELFIRSNQALKRVISQISTEQWNLELPLGTSASPTNLKNAVRYHTYDDAWVPDVLNGRTVIEVGDTFEELRSIDIDELKDTYVRYSQRAIESVGRFTDLNKTVHLSYGDYPAREYLQHIIAFRTFRSYDIAKLIGSNTVTDDDFLQALWDEFSPVIEDYRKMGVFPAALKVPDDASLQTKLLALAGRS